MVSKSVVMVFLDGVGLGEADKEVNPFMNVTMPNLQKLLGISHLSQETMGTITTQAALLGLDATLGVPGLPQSGTGQTAILTGHNAPAEIGKHYGPYPDSQLLDMLAQDNIFKTLLDRGQPVAYANAYPARFLERLKRGTGRLSANSRAAYISGLRLRTGYDLQQGKAISAFLSNDFWPEPDFPLPTLTPYQAGENLADIAKTHTLTFFEFWYSDLLGHKQLKKKSLQMLIALDDFLGGILNKLDMTRSLLLVVSDHGNFEDWTSSKHTKNPALTVLSGAGFQNLTPQLSSLADIKSAVLSYYLPDRKDLGMG